MRPKDQNFDIQEAYFLTEDFSQFFNIFEKIFKFYFFARDANGALTYISPKISEVLGYAPEDFKKNWKKYLTEHLTNKEVILRSEFPQYSGKLIKPYNVEIKSKNGEKIWLAIHETPILNPDGNVVKYHGLAIDYTERKSQENQLRIREKRFREISQSSPIGIFHADPNDLMTYVNPAWQIITGRPMAETLGRWEIPGGNPFIRKTKRKSSEPGKLPPRKSGKSPSSAASYGPTRNRFGSSFVRAFCSTITAKSPSEPWKTSAKEKPLRKNRNN
jgi:PAS domain S-box-containing protein